MELNEHNIILTGIPRSGTTLICHLLNILDDTVALHEPMKTLKLSKYHKIGKVSDVISSYFKKTRKSIQKNKKAVSKQVSGMVPDNPVISTKSESGLRIQVVKRAEIKVNKKFTSEGLLIIKHPSAFTAILKKLNNKFSVYATIRNPIAVLGSWNSVPMPVRKGHVPAAERLNKELKNKLKNIDDRIDRQLYILSWFYEQYYRNLPTNSIIRYEDLIESNGKILKIITTKAENLNVKLINKNSNFLYKVGDIMSIGERLLKSEGSYWKFYNKTDVEGIMNSIN